ncbi:MAG TPA: hypothetical protein VMS55_11815 [Myxococcota bacterium]|nr:hypothetical protein [Myxococcota bacterium]
MSITARGVGGAFSLLLDADRIRVSADAEQGFGVEGLSACP